MSKTEASSKSLKINFIFYCIKSAMSVIFPLISFPYASRILDVEGIGKVQYCTSVISYITLIAGLGISSYAIRESAKVRHDRTKFSKLILEIFSINVLSTLVAYLVLFAGIALHLFDGYVPILLSCSLATLCSTISVEWIYQAQEEYVYISIRTIITQAISLVLMFAFVRNTSDTVAYALVLVFASGGFCLINFFGALKYIDFHQKYVLNLKQHIKNILVMFSTTIASSIYLNLDVLMISFFMTDYHVGLYSAATKINVVLRGILNSASTVLMPRLSYYKSHDHQEEYLFLLKKGMQFSVLLSLPCAVGLTCLSPEIILLINGKNFLGAKVACCILAFNMVFSVLDNVIYTQILIPHGKEKDGCKGTILGASSNFVLNAIGIQLYGIEGAAVASLLAEFVVFVYFLFIIRSLFDMKQLFAESYKPIMAAVSIVLVVLGVKCVVANYILQIVCSIVLAVVAYFGTLLVMRYSLITDELKVILGRVRKNK